MCLQVKQVDLDVVSNPFSTSASLGHWLPVSPQLQAHATRRDADRKHSADDDGHGAATAAADVAHLLSLGSSCICRLRGPADEHPLGQHSLVEVRNRVHATPTYHIRRSPTPTPAPTPAPMQTHRPREIIFPICRYFSSPGCVCFRCPRRWMDTVVGECSWFALQWMCPGRSCNSCGTTAPPTQRCVSLRHRLLACGIWVTCNLVVHKLSRSPPCASLSPLCRVVPSDSLVTAWSVVVLRPHCPVLHGPPLPSLPHRYAVVFCSWRCLRTFPACWAPARRRHCHPASSRPCRLRRCCRL